jgi:hypothetical protein
LITNLFGFAIEGLDSPSFLAGMRGLFVTLALASVILAARTRDESRVSRIVLAVAALGHAMAWFATMFPLPNVYGANGSMDRENHLGWANMVALGFSPLRTFQVNHLHFEPLWPLITAVAAGFSLERVPAVFQWAPLVLGLLVLLSIRLVWPKDHASQEDSGTEGAFAALGALLLIAAPLDFSGFFRNPWALTFLLKPNHALGLVLAPLAALALARAHDWKSRLFAGFVLQLVGWAFVIHMALVVAGFALFLALSWLTRSPERRRDLLDVATAVGANLALVSPYLVMLLVAYPVFTGPDYVISPFSERAIEAPFRLGLLLPLSAYAAWGVYRDGGRLGRILSSQWLAAQIIWQAFPLLGLIGEAREQDEAFYWCRFWTGCFAAVGLFRLMQSMAHRWPRETRPGVCLPSPAAAITLLLLLPSLLPAWWNPARMDQYFVAARQPLPPSIAEPMRFVRENTRAEAVFGGDHDYARWIAAYGGRRVLMADSLNAPKDGPHRETVEVAIWANGPEPLVREGVERYGVRYMLATSTGGSGNPTMALDLVQQNPRLQTVFDRTFPDRRVLILKVLGPAS